MKKTHEEFKDMIPQELARIAKYNVSFEPDKRGEQERNRFADAMVEMQDLIFANPNRTDDEKISFTAKVAEKACDLKKKCLNAESRCASWAVTGRGNFPVARNEKRTKWYDNHMARYFEYLDKMKKAIKKDSIPEDQKPVIIGQDGATEKIKKQYETHEKFHDLAKKFNRSKKADDRRDLLKQICELGGSYTRETVGDFNRGFWSAEDYDKIPDENIVHSKFFMTNSNAKLKRLKQKLEKSQFNDDNENTEEVYKGYKIEKDFNDNRIRIYTDGKPCDAMRTKLKQNGFRYSPRNEAWQRQITRNAIIAVRQVIDWADENIKK